MALKTKSLSMPAAKKPEMDLLSQLSDHSHEDDEGSPDEEASESPDEEAAEDKDSKESAKDPLAKVSDDDLLAEIKKRGLMKKLGKGGDDSDPGLSSSGYNDDEGPSDEHDQDQYS